MLTYVSAEITASIIRVLKIVGPRDATSQKTVALTHVALTVFCTTGQPQDGFAPSDNQARYLSDPFDPRNARTGTAGDGLGFCIRFEAFTVRKICGADVQRCTVSQPQGRAIRRPQQAMAAGTDPAGAQIVMIVNKKLKDKSN
jgi:hypothetical protein